MKQVSVPTKVLKEIAPYAKTGVMYSPEVYISTEKTYYEIHWRYSLFAKVLVILLWPLHVLMEGFVNIKEVNKDTKRLVMDKANSVDSGYDQDTYDKIKEWL